MLSLTTSEIAGLRGAGFGFVFQGVVYDPEALERDGTAVLAEAMPELLTFDSSYGGMFRSRTVPSMKLLIHTGIDIIPGWCIRHNDFFLLC